MAKKQKMIVLFVAVVIIIGIGGLVNLINNSPTTYHYEAWLPTSNARNTRFTIAGIDDANITITFVNDPGLWYRIGVTHYTSAKHHAVEKVTNPSFLPPRVHLTSVTPVKTINVVLGTDVAHGVYISGENLNIIIIVDNGAKISDSRCRFYGTGIFQFKMTENVNFTTKGMSLKIGDRVLRPVSPELVVLDIDLPNGLNGRMSAPNATVFNNQWPFKYDNVWGTPSIDNPLLDIEIFYSMRVLAYLST